MSAPDRGTVWRLRVATGCVLLTALAFAQQPGRIAADTKVDLVVSPAAWLGRALHAWDPAGNFGQMQNQAYGYLWPMGPFFALGHLLAVPAWVVQRLWWALLLCLAFGGVVSLAGRLGIGTPWARLAGGLVYALSPRILSELGPVSVEAWPNAIAPWVLLPLVGLAGNRTRMRRAVAFSALAVAAAGGVNATAVLAVLPLPLLWLLTVRPLRRRVAALAAWGVAVAAATAWWVVPLLVLGRYSPPFLDYIETAATTTWATDVVSTVRGGSHWLAYLQGAYGPGWPAGWRLATETPLVVATMVVAGLGIAGLSRAGQPHRRFLVTGVLLGAAVVGLGHLCAVPGLFAPALHTWLDAGGAPLRNLHKFDLLLRVPLALGLTHLLGTLGRAATVAGRQGHPARLRAAAVGATAVTALAVVTIPAFVGGLPGRSSFLEVPGYWRAAAVWLDAHAGTSRVLVVPGARFPSYLWGAPGDEMVQPLLRSPWAVRNSIPLAPPTTVRLLDTVESVLAQGQGSPGLAELLARSGVRYLLVRADLDTGRSDSVRQLAVRAALARSPDITPVATFGPFVGGQPLGSYVDRGLDIAVPALQVFQVRPAVAPVGAYDLADVRTVVGGPESLLPLADAGQLSPAPTVLAGDLPAGVTTGGLALTDGLRRRELTFGRARENASATLTADDPWRLDQPAHDFVAPGAARWESVVRYHGIRDVTASSSYAEALTLTGNRPEHQPYAALDGDPATSWRSAPGTVAAGQWLQVSFDQPRRITQVHVAVDLGADAIPTRIAVQAGNERRSVTVDGESVTVPLDGWLPVTSVRVTVEAVWSVRPGYGGVGLTEVTIPGVQAQRTLMLPAPVSSTTDGAPGDTTPVAAVTRPAAPAVVLENAPSIPSCYFLDRRPYCSAELPRASEDGAVLDRTVPWPSVTGDYSVRLWARPRAGAELSAAIDDAVAGHDTPRVTASSIGVADPAARPGAVVDGDSDTTWYAADEDRTPWLRLAWSSPRTVTGLRIALGDRAAASRPWSVTVLTDAGARRGTLEADGVLALDPPVRTNDLTVLFTDGSAAVSFDPYAGRFERLPVGVGELTVLPAASTATTRRDAVVRMPCGQGPTVEVAGRRIPTAFSATVADLLERREIPMRLCAAANTVDLRGADRPVRVIATGTRYALPTRLALVPGSAPAAATAPVDSVLSIDRWAPAQRRITLAGWPGARLLVLRENTNAGWQARIGAQVLRPVVVDGWQQGWIVPAGLSGAVSIDFAPDGVYRAGLVGGAVLLAAVAFAALPFAPGRTPASAQPVSAQPESEPLSAPPVSAPPVSAPPVSAPPVSVPPVSAPPVSAPTGSVGRSRRRLLVLAGAAALVLTGGYVALILLVLGMAGMLVLAATAGNHRRLLLQWAPVVLFALACVLSLRAVDPHAAVGPQLAGVAALVALWLGGTIRPSRGVRPRHRWR